MAKNLVAQFLNTPENNPDAIIVPVERLQVRVQPRKYFDSERIDALAKSIEELGLLVPLIVRPVGDKFEVLAGERRYRAIEQLGWDEVSVVVQDVDDRACRLIALADNLEREDLNPFEETEGIVEVVALELDKTFEEAVAALWDWRNQNRRGDLDCHSVMTIAISTVFETLGKNPNSFIVNYLPLLNLPDPIKEVLRQGKIAYTKAKAIAQVKDEAERSHLLQVAIEKNLSLSAIKEHIGQLRQPRQVPSVVTRSQSVMAKLRKAKLEGDRAAKVEELLAQIEELLS